MANRTDTWAFTWGELRSVGTCSRMPPLTMCTNNDVNKTTIRTEKNQDSAAVMNGSWNM